MMKSVSTPVLMMVLLAACTTARAQSTDTILFTPLGSYNFSLFYSGYTPLIDRLGRPYVYLATKELGMVTFDISNTSDPLPADTIPVAALSGLKATGVAQDSAILFISLGDFESATEKAGLAIFDVSNPLSPLLLDEWDSAAFTNGTAGIIVKDHYAYLAAMDEGVLILDVTDKHHIKFVSRIIPDLSFGNHHYTYHARGLFLSGDTLLVADDNGGLRMIDVSDKQNPVETGKYLNETIDSIGAAYYNHVYRIGNRAYCAVDFCGFETVDVSNPAAMTGMAWLNPWDCTIQPPPFGSWLGSNGHTNEIAYAAQDILFFSGGDSQVLAFDASDPEQPRIMGAWGAADDGTGSWGLDVFGNLAAVANIHTLGFPFVSTIGGLQLLSWQQLLNVPQVPERHNQVTVVPDPFDVQATVQMDRPFQEATLTLSNLMGNTVKELTHINGNGVLLERGNLPDGVYLLHVTEQGQTVAMGKIVIVD